MKMFGAFRGATAYEVWLWRFYIRIPYWKYLSCGSRITIGFDKSSSV